MMKTILTCILLTFLLFAGFMGIILIEIPDIVGLYAGIICGIIGGCISIREMVRCLNTL